MRGCLESGCHGREAGGSENLQENREITRMSTRTLMCACTHIYAAQIDRHTQTDTHTATHTDTHTNTHTKKHKHAYTCTHTHTHTHIRTHTTNTHTLSLSLSLTHTHTHTQTHTHTHTHTHTGGPRFSYDDKKSGFLTGVETGVTAMRGAAGWYVCVSVCVCVYLSMRGAAG